MKKILVYAFAAMMIAGCNSAGKQSEAVEKTDKGAENACLFVKEQVPELREDIASVEVVGVDTLLSDILLYDEAIKVGKAGNDLLERSIKYSEYRTIMNEAERIYNDIHNSWAYSLVVNDSLRQLKKYENCWRKVYKIKVTMKSGVTREPRVLMDIDGVTPIMIEKDFEKQLNEHYYTVTWCPIDTIGLDLFGW